jgi:hypothetical protein
MTLHSYLPEPKFTLWYIFSICGSVIAPPAKLYGVGESILPP